MIIRASSPHDNHLGVIEFGGRRAACFFGKNGIRRHKREGDLATPCGSFPLRRVFWRPDRLSRPRTALPLTAIHRRLGWCDDSTAAEYNRAVRLPFAHGYEPLSREDDRYDVLITIGYNDQNPQPSRGSAIFIHTATAATTGCIGIGGGDLTALLATARIGSRIIIYG